MPDNNTAATPSIPPVDPGVPAVSEPTASAATLENVTPENAVAEAVASTAEPVVAPVVPNFPMPSVGADAGVAKEPTDSGSVRNEVASKIRDSRNVLIALSSDPSVDEMAAAIGLSLYLDKLGKRATAIYSGATPNALEFLKPEETFEPTVDTLQDFVIALNKDKADHLRYKLDGDYVKIYITPYKTRIAEEDLDFSYGDFNVDLVLALDVANGIDLDSALREHGRIMHDAVIVNITTGNPGKFGEIEWSEKKASSVSEMIARLLYGSAGETKIGKEEATAFLTGIVAATNRFSNGSTTPETMQVASKLMESGANQQLVSKNITPDVENEMFSLDSAKPAGSGISDPTKLNIAHRGEIEETDKQVDATVTEKESTLLDDLRAAEASLSQAGAETMPESDKAALEIDSEKGTSSLDHVASVEAEVTETTEPVSAPMMEMPQDESEPKAEDKAEPKAEPVEEAEPEVKAEPAIEPITEPVAEESAKEAGGSEAGGESVAASEPVGSDEPVTEKVLQPSGDFGSSPMTLEEENKYGKMLEDALESVSAPSAPEPVANPAAMNAPAVANAPEINGVPEMNYMPMPGEEVLPPPPVPPIDMGGAMPAAAPVAPVAAVDANAGSAALPTVGTIAPAAPVEEPKSTPFGDQPAMQDQVYGAQAADPSAFKIPGM